MQDDDIHSNIVRAELPCLSEVMWVGNYLQLSILLLHSAVQFHLSDAGATTVIVLAGEQHPWEELCRKYFAAYLFVVTLSSIWNPFTKRRCTLSERKNITENLSRLMARSFDFQMNEHSHLKLALHLLKYFGNLILGKLQCIQSALCFATSKHEDKDSRPFELYKVTIQPYMSIHSHLKRFDS